MEFRLKGPISQIITVTDIFDLSVFKLFCRSYPDISAVWRFQAVLSNNTAQLADVYSMVCWRFLYSAVKGTTLKRFSVLPLMILKRIRR